MTKTTLENEQIKRDFFDQLKGAKGFAKSSIVAFSDAISQWQKFTENESFSKFTKEEATAFVEWLSTKPSKTKTGKIALVTQDNYLRRVKKFFEWLSDQPRYKSKVSKNEVEWLRLSKTDARIARMGTTRTEPVFGEVKKVIESINSKSEIDMRDRAIISLALITGARISAITSLKMRSFDKKKNIVYQNPKDGIKTKSSKLIATLIFPIEWREPERYFVEWYEYLESKGFRPDDPIFPATFNNIGDKKSNKAVVSKRFWSNANSARNIFKTRCLDAGIPYFNPHSFRHLIVGMWMEDILSEKVKKAISLNLGHESVSTTFDSYGYSNMTQNEVFGIINNLKNLKVEAKSTSITQEEREAIEKLLKRSA